jgi:hypothetical protein
MTDPVTEPKVEDARVGRVRQAQALVKQAQQRIERIQEILQGLTIPGVTAEALEQANGAINRLLDTMGVAEDWARETSVPKSTGEQFKDLMNILSSDEFLRDVERAAAAPPPTPLGRYQNFVVKTGNGKVLLGVCIVCGVLVVDRTKHDDHHKNIQAVATTAASADRTASMLRPIGGPPQPTMSASPTIRSCNNFHSHGWHLWSANGTTFQCHGFQ